MKSCQSWVTCVASTIAVAMKRCRRDHDPAQAVADDEHGRERAEQAEQREAHREHR